LLNKIILEIKETEDIADNIIKEAISRSDNIIKEAQLESDKLKEKVKKETLEEGKLKIEKEKILARIEADNIIKNSEREKDELHKKSLKNIDGAVKIVINEVMEGK
jgi:vacuolar-type H+-ATPase subunit H